MGLTIIFFIVLIISINAKIEAATNAIIEPLPVSYSAEKYSPIITVITPIIWERMTHERKLFPINCAVAAGATLVVPPAETVIFPVLVKVKL